MDEMEVKLESLYEECYKELISIGFNFTEKNVGIIEIHVAKRNAKRYGCCKQFEPDNKYKVIEKRGRKRYVKYNKYNRHKIEISRWVLELDKKIIKNTIIHEMLHCLPYCSNHGVYFRKYADYINKNLGYNISRLGNKKEDYERSNLQYNDVSMNYKYIIKCKECGKVIYRKRLQKNFFYKYRCLCGGKLEMMKKIPHTES